MFFFGEIGKHARQEVCAKIDAVTAQDLVTVVRKALSTPPSLSVVGSDLDGVPTHQEVCSWFKSVPLPAAGVPGEEI